MVLWPITPELVRGARSQAPPRDLLNLSLWARGQGRCALTSSAGIFVCREAGEVRPYLKQGFFLLTTYWRKWVTMSPFVKIQAEARLRRPPRGRVRFRAPQTRRGPRWSALHGASARGHRLGSLGPSRCPLPPADLFNRKSQDGVLRPFKAARCF